jgi:predicted MPP superfamily phosphohydrolase
MHRLVLLNGQSLSVSRFSVNKKSIALILFFGFLLFLWSFLIEPGFLTENIQTKNKWPYKSIKIVFFSDLHAGAPHIDEKYLINLVERINSHSADIVLIGGDLLINGVVGGKFMEIGRVVQYLKKLKAPLGRYVVFGNHDWWNDSDAIRKELVLNGFVVLENESQLIDVGNDQKFNLIGIGDRFTNHSDPIKAFSQISEKYPSIVFMHDPASLFEIKNQFFLALAGHTHGGQVFVPGVGAIITPTDAPKAWAKGWTEFELGSLYVSQGIGTSILPVRFNASPEFLILSLEK